MIGGITYRKRFGQHFLTDENVLARIVDAFSPANDEIILEIGPGRGALTAHLLARISHLIAVEIDRSLVAMLSKKYDSERLTIVQADILNFAIGSVFDCYTTPIVAAHLTDQVTRQATHRASKKVRLIGNLPYQISTPLLFHLLKSVEHIQDMVFMVQKEVAQRLSARPDSKTYGRLSVMVALQLDCQCLFDVQPDAFEPPPKVESTLIRLTPKSTPHKLRDRDRFNKIVKLAFSQRRKTLRNSLQPMISAEQFEKAQVDSAQRAENLTVQQFIQLSNA